MAVDHASEPWTFTADADAYDPDHPIYVSKIVLLAGATAGEIEVTNGSGGKVLARETLTAQDMFVVPIMAWLTSGGIFIEDLVAGGQVQVYTGKRRVFMVD